jgi:Ca2+-binding RTX toxin-like protein
MAIVTGTSGNDNLNGTSGNDRLQGLAGDDILFGAFFGNDIFDGGTGIDTASFAGLSNNINASLETNKATFFGGSGTFIDIENIIASDNSDIVVGNEGRNQLEGRAGDDDLSGRGGNDTLLGGAGRDLLKGEQGDDNLKGGDDVDVLEGGDGNDGLEGNKGNDTMIGGNGADTFGWFDGDGSDLMQGGEGNDSVFFDGAVNQGDQITLNPSGSDVLLQRTNLVPVTLTLQSVENVNSVRGLGGDDVFTIGNVNFSTSIRSISFEGGNGNDRMLVRNPSFMPIDIIGNGGNGSDSLNGGSGNDKLEGGQGNDFLVGDGGDDRLTGAGGTNNGRGEIDVLVGGTGRDVFVIGSAYDDGNNLADGDMGAGSDGGGDFARIIDFKIGEDLIELKSGIQYVLKPINGSLAGGSAAQDIGIFRKNGPTLVHPDELVAIVQDAPSGLNLSNTLQFRGS